MPRSVSPSGPSVALACAAVAGLLTGATPARADGPPAAGITTSAPSGPQGGDVVYLKDGGIVRGTLVDAVPQRPVRIQLATGEIWSIDRAYVDRVVPLSAAPVAPAPPVPSGPMVRLHVDSPRDLEVFGHPSDSAQWIPLCSGACDEPVPASWEYQVRGAGVRASPPFLLRAEPGRSATVRVDPGSKEAFDFGLFGFCGGTVIGLVGLIVTAVGASGHIQQTQNGVTTDQPVSPSVLPIGVGILAVGVAATVVGGIVALDNMSTTVTQTPSRAAQADAQPAPFVEAAREGPRLPDVATSTLLGLRL